MTWQKVISQHKNQVPFAEFFNRPLESTEEELFGKDYMKYGQINDKSPLDDPRVQKSLAKRKNVAQLTLNLEWMTQNLESVDDLISDLNGLSEMTDEDKLERILEMTKSGKFNLNESEAYMVQIEEKSKRGTNFSETVR